MTASSFAGTYRYGKTVSKALSIASHLAHEWKAGKKITAEELATVQRLPKPWVARLLGYLAQAGIVKAFRGPGGGYVLAREPASIRLWEVVVVFQSEAGDGESMETWGGIEQALFQSNRILREYLEQTTLGVFVV